MSESLLLNLIELLAITSKFRRDRSRLKNIVSFFLRSQLQVADAQRYESIFDSRWRHLSTKADLAYEVNESTRAVKICTALNSELTQPQKIAVLILMFSITEDNRSISETELQFIQAISDLFNISESDFFLCVSFNLISLNDDASAGRLVAFSDHAEGLRQDRSISLKSLAGSIAILKIESIDSYYVKYMGDQPIQINDVPMLDNVIYRYSFGDVIRLSNGQTLHFSDIVSEISNDQQRILMQVEKVSFTFPDGRIGVHEISFSETSGKLVGLMGASGAGKSTLMEILNGNFDPSTGRVLINNINVHTEKDKIEGIIGYVPQDDLLIEDLTVFQNLYFAARLGFADKSVKEINDLVTTVISDLGLEKVAHSKVGTALNKVISGGQRKRVNIGLELLRAPSVMFLDEPTSGLSSRDSQNIMELLKKLSRAGKLIFVVIHQPSPDIFKLFDKLLIMDTGGYPIYYGNPLEAITYFKSKTNRLNKNLIYDHGRLNPEVIFDLIEARTVTEFGKYTNVRRTAPIEWYYEFRKRFVPSKELFAGPRLNAIRAANWFKQLKTFITRDALSKFNNQQYMLINILQAPVLALFLSSLSRYYDGSITEGHYVFSGNQNLPVFLFISIIVALFMGLTISAEEIVQDRKILKRERFLNLSRSSYLISKIIILFTMSAFQTLSFWLIAGMVLKLPCFSAVHFWLLFSASAFANMLGLNISAMFNKAITVYILIPILLIPQLVLGGIVLQFDKINPDLKVGNGVPIASELIVARWAYEGLMVSFFVDNEYNRHFFQTRLLKHRADHQFMYRAPSLESKIQHAILYVGTSDIDKIKKIEKDLELVRNELRNDPIAKFSKPERLTFGCDSSVLAEALESVKRIKSHWSKASNDRAYQEEDIVRALKVVYKPNEDLDKLLQQNHNETVEKVVRDVDSDKRIVEQGGRLEVLADPIYREPEGNRVFSVSHFFSPYKYLFWQRVATPVFNSLVIWSITALLYVSLYFNVFRWIKAWFSRRVYLRFVNIVFGKRTKL